VSRVNRQELEARLLGRRGGDRDQAAHQERRATMSEDELLARHASQAVRRAAEMLDMKPLVLAKHLQDGEIARLVELLNAALPQVSQTGLRHRVEDLLSAVTDGRMPMFGNPESELDWAMETLRKRRRDGRLNDGATDAGTTEADLNPRDDDSLPDDPRT
jgi:hypothetical protein